MLPTLQADCCKVDLSQLLPFGSEGISIIIRFVRVGGGSRPADDEVRDAQTDMVLQP